MDTLYALFVGFHFEVKVQIKQLLNVKLFVFFINLNFLTTARPWVSFSSAFWLEHTIKVGSVVGPVIQASERLNFEDDLKICFTLFHSESESTPSSGT